LSTLLHALLEALRLVLSADAGVLQYAQRSLAIALIATLLASVLGIPAGVWLAEVEFPGKRAVVTVLNTLLSVPTVVVGLMVYAFISRHGPLGDLGLLFTVPGIILGEVVLILPLITAFTLAAVSRVDRDVRRTALSLGASSSQALAAVVRESRFGILAAVIAAFGRVVGEVGVATILGGNADAFTRTITTAIVLEVNMGRFEVALALGLVLLALSFGINVLLQLVQGEGRKG
jgi:tungstate transport system permease protein